MKVTINLFDKSLRKLNDAILKGRFEVLGMNGERPSDLFKINTEEKSIAILQDKLHRRNLLCNARAKEIEGLKTTIKILGEGLNAIKDAFYNTKQNPQIFIGNVEAILNATKNKL